MVQISESYSSTFLTPFHVLHYGPLMGSKNGEEVINYVHELPDETWHEPSPTDPLSLIDQVELSMAYHCEEQLSQQTLLRYIHQNRHHNSLKINSMGKLVGELRETLEEEIKEQERKMESAMARGIDQAKEEVESF